MNRSARGKSDSSGRRFVQVTQAELAAIGGLSRQTVNEILSKWKRAGRISTGYGGLWVHD
jgi:CRP-like cAMP-binding protein